MAKDEKELLETAKRLEEIISTDNQSKYGFPLKDTIISMTDTKLQSQHDKNEAIKSYGHLVKNPLEDCIWFWFESPDWTWKHLCGRAGWMVLSKSDLKVIDFFLESMN